MIESRCGIKCSECEYECRGCLVIDKPFWGDQCPVKSCCEEKKLMHCGDCDTFPCKLLNSFAYDKEQGDNGLRIEHCRKWAADKFEFKDFDCLTDGEIALRLSAKTPANAEKGFVPAYKYHITLSDSQEKIGDIDIRIGYNEGLYYGGNIGYGVDEAFRGNSYASKACKLIRLVAADHGMRKLIITCNPDNHASKRTCEKAGLTLKETIKLPPHNDMYQRGEKEKCIYEWII